MPNNLNSLPEELKRALMYALVKSGVKPPSDDEPVDESPGLMIEAIQADGDGIGAPESLRNMLRGMSGRLDTRRPATAKEASVLVKLAGPCRFNVGDRVKWNPDLHEENFTFPKLGDVCVVTQVFHPAMHDMNDAQTSGIAVRNDFAVAYMRDMGAGKMLLQEYTYDSRRFVLADGDPTLARVGKPARKRVRNVRPKQ